jgi:hypothetical protein
MNLPKQIIFRILAVFYFLWVGFVSVGGTVFLMMQPGTFMFGAITTAVMLALFIGFPKVAAAPITYLIGVKFE